MMGDLTTWLTEAGPAGMFVSAILAGSVFPFSSEVVMMTLLSAGADPVSLLVWGTVGNVLGSVINYGLGRLGREEWMVKYAKVSREKLDRGRRYVTRYGPLAGLLAWIPLLGSVVTVAMGFMRTNPLWSFVAIAFGKYLRYQIIISAWLMTASS